MPSATVYLDRKTNVPSEMRTVEWNTVKAQIRERAFFMASVAQGDILQQFRDTAKRVARGDIDAGTARALIHNYLGEIGYTPKPGLEKTIKDLRTSRRMKVSIETNVEMAHGWAKRQEDMGSIRYPAWQFYREQPAKKPRDWKKEWERAFKEVKGEGCAKDGYWIALITSPIWSALSKFDQPHPPFDYGSHMNVRRVSMDESIRHGIDLDRATWTNQADEHLESFNENVSAPQTAKWDASVRQAVMESMQGLVREERTKDGVWLVMTDVNGTKKYDWDQIGEVISPKNNLGIPSYQYEAFLKWIADSGQFTKGEKVGTPIKNFVEDFARLIDRIKPVEANGYNPKETIHRALHFSNLKKFESVKKKLDKPETGNKEPFYTARTNVIGESWSNNEATAHRFADKKNNIILHCAKYKSRKRIDGIYRQIEKNNTKMAKELFGNTVFTEGESIIPSRVRFRVVSKGKKKRNQYGGYDWEYDVEEE